jgi:hypothetical protein
MLKYLYYFINIIINSYRLINKKYYYVFYYQLQFVVPFLITTPPVVFKYTHCYPPTANETFFNVKLL